MSLQKKLLLQINDRFVPFDNWIVFIVVRAAKMMEAVPRIAYQRRQLNLYSIYSWMSRRSSSHFRSIYLLICRCMNGRKVSLSEYQKRTNTIDSINSTIYETVKKVTSLLHNILQQEYRQLYKWITQLRMHAHVYICSTPWPTHAIRYAKLTIVSERIIAFTATNYFNKSLSWLVIKNIMHAYMHAHNTCRIGCSTKNGRN